MTRHQFELKYFYLTHQLIMRKSKSRSYSRLLSFGKIGKESIKLDTYRFSKLISKKRAYCRKTVLNFVVNQADKY